jgi:hypothetical protein
VLLYRGEEVAAAGAVRIITIQKAMKMEANNNKGIKAILMIQILIVSKRRIRKKLIK